MDTNESPMQQPKVVFQNVSKTFTKKDEDL